MANFLAFWLTIQLVFIGIMMSTITWEEMNGGVTCPQVNIITTPTGTTTAPVVPKFKAVTTGALLPLIYFLPELHRVVECKPV